MNSKRGKSRNKQQKRKKAEMNSKNVLEHGRVAAAAHHRDGLAAEQLRVAEHLGGQANKGCHADAGAGAEDLVGVGEGRLGELGGEAAHDVAGLALELPQRSVVALLRRAEALARGPLGEVLEAPPAAFPAALLRHLVQPAVEVTAQ